MAEGEKGVPVLLSFWCSPYAHKVQIALEEKGVAYEYKEEDVVFAKSPLLLQSNPVYGKVPVLLHGGKAVCESAIILHYLDEAWSDAPPLLPGEPYQRANARFWADFVDKKGKRGGMERALKEVFGEGLTLRNTVKSFGDWGVKVWKSNGATQAEAAKELIGALKQLEGELGEKPYFAGEAFGYVDASVIGFSTWMQVLGRVGGFSMGKECPQLQAWTDRCMQRDSVSKVLPPVDKVLEFAVAVRKKLGLE